MENVIGHVKDGRIVLELIGRVDSSNAAKADAAIQKQISGKAGMGMTIDAAKLDYISSAGLRVLLRIRKTFSDMEIINVSPEVYEVLDMTGFTELMQVKRAYRVVSIDGCEVIGQGANGTIYKIDNDNIVKVYNNPDSLGEIQHEREVAKAALILGIPTAISYDVVRVGNSYGSVFELLDAKSFSKLLATDPGRLDWCVAEYVELLKKIHATLVPAGTLPDMRLTALDWVHFMKDHMEPARFAKLEKMMDAVPHDDHMIHGDYHTKNIELQGDEVLLIDMDTLAVGHPIFELASMYNAYKGFSELDHSNVKKFLGVDYDLMGKFWMKSLALYLETDDPARIREVEDKARIVGYVRLIRRLIRRKGLETEDGRKLIDHWKGELYELLENYDTLLF